MDSPLLEVVQGQDGHGSEQIDAVDNVPVQSRWDGLKDLQIKEFYDSTILLWKSKLVEFSLQ